MNVAQSDGNADPLTDLIQPNHLERLRALVEELHSVGGMDYMARNTLIRELDAALTARPQPEWANVEAPGVCDRGHRERQLKCPACHDLRIAAWTAARPAPPDPPEGWHPIETAPTAFGWFLGYGPTCGVAVFCRLDGELLSIGVNLSENSIALVNVWQPTHWRRLPDPPEAESK